MPEAKYKSRATNEIVLVPMPLDETMISFKKADGSSHQLARQMFDGQYFAAELPRADAARLQEMRLAGGRDPGNPIGVTIDQPPAWFLEFSDSVNDRLDNLAKSLYARLDDIQASVDEKPKAAAPAPSTGG